MKSGIKVSITTLVLTAAVVGSAAWIMAQELQPGGGRQAVAVPPKPVSEEFLLLGDETRGSGEAQMVVDPTDPNNIIATGMGTWQAIPGCEAPNVNCKDFHNFPNSTWPVSAQTFDGGRTWKAATVNPPRNKYAWQRFTASVDLPSAGYYEVWARATDSKGATQPFVATNWNPQGYGANPISRIRVLVEA